MVKVKTCANGHAEMVQRLLASGAVGRLLDGKQHAVPIFKFAVFKCFIVPYNFSKCDHNLPPAIVCLRTFCAQGLLFFHAAPGNCESDHVHKYYVNT